MLAIKSDDLLREDHKLLLPANGRGWENSEELILITVGLGSKGLLNVFNRGTSE